MEHHKVVKALGKDKVNYEQEALKALNESDRQALRTSSAVACDAWLRKNGGSEAFWAAAKKQFPLASWAL